MHIRFEDSFANHPRFEFWSAQNVLDPTQLTLGSGKKVSFDCNECSHTFEMKLNDVVRGRWCQYCASRLLCQKECDSCYEKSFASNSRKKYWSSDNEKSPRNVFKNTGVKYKFDCDCGHTFESKLADVNNGSWCPYCSNPRIALCGDSECENCLEASFEDESCSEHFNPNNKEVPRNILKHSNKSYLFICPDCNLEFNQMIYKINKNKRLDCPRCSCKK